MPSAEQIRVITPSSLDRLFAPQMVGDRWRHLKDRLTALFLTKMRDEWRGIMEGTDLCFAPFLNLREAPKQPSKVGRGTFYKGDGFVMPGSAPRFLGTPAPVPSLKTR